MEGILKISSQQKTEATLNFKGSYPDFPAFYELHKVTIYDEFTRLLCNLSDSDADALHLSISANIEDFDWEATFSYSSTNLDVLVESLLQFFIEKESYEKCAAIRDAFELYKKRTNQSPLEIS
jgi:hypothetical protein